MNSLAIVVFTAYIACAFSASTNGSNEPVHAVRHQVVAASKRCASDHKLPEDQIKITFNQDLPKDEKERCYLECVYSAFNIVRDGEYSPEGASKLISLRFEGQERELGDKLVATCAKEIKKGDEKCAIAKDIRECFARNGKQVNFFPTS